MNKKTSITVKLRSGEERTLWCNYDEFKMRQDFMEQKEKELAEYMEANNLFPRTRALIELLKKHNKQ